MSKGNSDDKPGTLFDRIALGIWSGVFALILGAVLWLLLEINVEETLIPFQYVGYFAGGMAILGFLLCDNVIVAVLGGLMQVTLEPQEKRSGWWIAAVAAGAAAVLWWLSRK